MTSAEREAVARILNDVELNRVIELFNEPIDFDVLERDAILKRCGRWWQVLVNIHDLPDAVAAKIRAVSYDRLTRKTCVQFEKPRQPKARK